MIGQRASAGDTLLGLIGLALIAGGLVWCRGWPAGWPVPALPFLFARCTVGITGTAASLTVEGPHAEEACRLAAEQRQTTYRASSEPGQPVVCEYRLGDQHVRVRDDGVLKLVGNALCERLRAQGAGP